MLTLPTNWQKQSCRLNPVLISLALACIQHELDCYVLLLGFLCLCAVSQNSHHICECKSSQTLRVLAETLSQFRYSSWETEILSGNDSKVWHRTNRVNDTVCSALFYTSSISESWGLSWSGALIFARLGKCDSSEAYKHIFVKQDCTFIGKLNNKSCPRPSALGYVNMPTSADKLKLMWFTRL